MIRWLVIFGLLLWPQKVWAVEGGVQVSPPFVSLKIDDQQSEVSQELVVKNLSNQTMVFKLRAIDFGSMDESGGIAFLNTKNEGESKYGLASWMLLEKDGLVVDPGKEETIKITVINKESLSPGGHYGAIWFMAENPEKVNKVELAMSYASLFYVAKTGGAKYELKLNRIDFDKNWWKKINKMDIRFENSGNVHLTPRGIIEVWDWNNTKVASGAINRDSTMILPESFRIYPIKINSLKNWWWPGNYRIEVNYRMDGQNVFKKISSNWFYLPWWLVIIPILLITVFVLKKRRNIFK